jgi:hypothetical protein
MARQRRTVAASVALVAVAAAAYLWATGLMDSLYAYRSPFAAAPLSAGLPVGSPLAGRVVVVLVDGLRVDTAADPAVMPELDRLRRSGASATLHSTTPSYSIPSWTVLMTGAWPELSDGPAMNPLAGQTSRTWTQDNLMAAAHRAGLTTAYAGTDWFPQLFQPGTVDHLAPLHEETDAADEASTVALLGFLAARPALGRGRDQGRRPDRPGRRGPGPPAGHHRCRLGPWPCRCRRSRRSGRDRPPGAACRLRSRHPPRQLRRP